MNCVADLVNRVAQRVDTASDDVSYQMTLSLRSFAIAAGWPVHIANHLEIIVEEGNFIPAWPRVINDEVRDLEYGVTDDEPNPVLRRFANRAESMAYLRMNRALS